MSGIYIPGVTMPQSCYDSCPCQALHWCNALNADTTDVLMEWRRLDGCPLIPVPEHGRLIDADALRQSIKESVDECHKWANEVEGGEMYARVSQALGTFVECSLRVKAAPTIIPGEEGEG